MASTIKLKNGSGAPTTGDLVQGEPALDLTNKRLYTENASGVVIEVGTNPSTIDINAGTIDGTVIGGTTPAAVTTSSLVATTADINAGTIDGTVIGGSSAAAVTGTTITGTSFVSSGDMTFGDSDKAIFGAGSDLQIYHDGTNSYISDQGTNDLKVLATDFQLKNSADNEFMMTAVTDGAVTLYHNNAAKLATTATGIDVTGTVTADGLTVDGGSISGAYAVITNTEGTAKFGTDSNYARVLDGSNNTLMAQSNAESYYYNNGVKVLKTASGGDISFYEDTGTTAKFFWDASAESLGIGTSSPSASCKLHIKDGSGEDAIALIDVDTGAGDSILALRNHLKIWNVGIDKSDSNKLVIAQGGDFNNIPAGAVMTMTTAGNVGIGASPDVKLHVKVNTDANFKVLDDSGVRMQAMNDAADTINTLKIGGNPLIFLGSGGGENMRIDSSGNVGIGTTSAVDSSKVQISGAKTISSGILQQQLNIADTSAIATGVGGGVSFSALYSGSSFTTMGSIEGNRENGTSGNYAGALVFKTRTNLGSNDERMRIDSSGNVLINCTSLPSGGIDAMAYQNTGDTALLISSLGTGGSYKIRFFNANGEVGNIISDGSATAYNTSSDQRLKENITDANDAGDKIDAIKVRQYDWKVDGSHQDYGMVAQELMTVAPEAVSGDPESDEMMGVDYSKLVPMLIKEIQSLRARVAQLEGAN
jgi:hypothetical protein